MAGHFPTVLILWSSSFSPCWSLYLSTGDQSCNSPWSAEQSILSFERWTKQWWDVHTSARFSPQHSFFIRIPEHERACRKEEQQGPQKSFLPKQSPFMCLSWAHRCGGEGRAAPQAPPRTTSSRGPPVPPQQCPGPPLAQGRHSGLPSANVETEWAVFSFIASSAIRLL